jgi:hypothetical protein
MRLTTSLVIDSSRARSELGWIAAETAIEGIKRSFGKTENDIVEEVS